MVFITTNDGVRLNLNMVQQYYMFEQNSPHDIFAKKEEGVRFVSKIEDDVAKIYITWAVRYQFAHADDYNYVTEYFKTESAANCLAHSGC